MENCSEVAQLLQRVQEEHESAERGLFGLSSGNAKHDFIRQRFENVKNVHERLQELVGPDAAMTLIANTIWSPEDQRRI